MRGCPIATTTTGSCGPGARSTRKATSTGATTSFSASRTIRPFEADAQRGLMKVSYHYKVGKIGLDSHAGWVATVDGRQGDVFVQRFKFDPEEDYPDGSSVEFWHNGVGRIHAYNKWMDMPDNRDENPYVFESEVLSPFARLRAGRKLYVEVRLVRLPDRGRLSGRGLQRSWAGFRAAFLSSQRDGVRLRGRFGVFQLGRLSWKHTTRKPR